MNISYINLGVRFDKDKGEIVPNLPKNGTHLQVIDFKSIWKNQCRLDPNAQKGTSGMIFPFAFDIFYDIDTIKSEGMLSNGLIFIDIDCGKEYVKPIFDKLDDINSYMGGIILTAATTSKGLHIICVSEPLTANEYKRRGCDLLACTAFSIMKVTGIDLRKIPNAIDTCTLSMKQRLYLRYSPEIYWHDGAVIGTLSTEMEAFLRGEYPDLYNKANNRSNYNDNEDVNINVDVDLNGIFDVPMHEYIDHHQRWTLFDSICSCYDGDEHEINLQWIRCSRLITEGHGHDTQFFIDEPAKNGWFDKWKGKKNHYCNRDFLREFGYDIKDVQYYGVSNIPMPSNIDELMEPHLNF